MGLLLVGYTCLAISTATSPHHGAAHDSRLAKNPALGPLAERGPGRRTTSLVHPGERAAAPARADTLRARTWPQRIPLPATDVRSAFWRLFIELLGPGAPHPATIRALFSRHAMEHGGATQLPALWRRAMMPALQRITMQGMAPEALLDSALAALDIQVEAASPWGWRLRPQLVSGAAELPDIFVVRENGAFRILATSSMLAPMGAQALHLIWRSDLEGAGRWLDWARAHAPTAGDHDAIAAFSILWSEHGPRDRSAMIRAAASLVATGAQAASAVPMLRTCAGHGVERAGETARACRAALVAARARTKLYALHAAPARSRSAQPTSLRTLVRR